MAVNFFQIFVRLLDNKTLTLQFPVQPQQPPITTESIKQRIESLTQIPSQFQKLTLNGKLIDDQTRIPQKLNLSTIHVNFSLLGGKGGFGSLLRGAATKAGQKKTNNFDACRDMSGRRLRHVNAEKKLEEWKAEEEERKLEKVAEDYIKKMAKTEKKKGGGDGTEKYVQKYREESARCVEEVERSVRESVGELLVGKKRKFMEKLKVKAAKEGVDAKKLKIWMGKRSLGESDSDDTDEDESDSDDAEHERSVVIDNGNQSDSSKELDGSSGAKSAELLEVACAGRSPESGSEEEKDTITGGSSEPSVSPSGSNESPEVNGLTEPSVDGEGHKLDQDEKISAMQVQQGSHSVAEIDKEVCTEPIVGHPSNISASQELEGLESARAVAEANEAARDKTVVLTEASNGSTAVPEVEDRPINLDDFSSAADLEVLGLEKLKAELQVRGLKCGGTLQERAARLFLLKTTPIEKLPRKLLAKK